MRTGVAAAMAVAATCGCASARTPDGATDRCEGGGTYWYLVSGMDHGVDPAVPGIAPGYDLDGRVSDDTDAAGCFHPDLTSPPPESTPGVDNQLAPRAGVSDMPTYDLEGLAREAIAGGELLLGIELAHVDDWDDDDCVAARVQQVQLVGSAAPLFEGDRLVAGQVIAPLAGTGDALGSGRIVEGRLQLASGTMEEGVVVGLPLPTPAGIGSYPFGHVRLGGRAYPDRLERVVFGGAMDVEGVVATNVGLGFDEAVVRSIVEGQADLWPDDAGRCTAVSGAVLLEAVAAVLEGG